MDAGPSLAHADLHNIVVNATDTMQTFDMFTFRHSDPDAAGKAFILSD
jgi:hypothetical protein